MSNCMNLIFEADDLSQASVSLHNTTLELRLAWLGGLNCAWLALGLAWALLELELIDDVLRSVSAVLLYLIKM